MEAAVAHLVGGREAAAGVEDTAILAPMPTLRLDVVAAFLFLSPTSSCHQGLKEGLLLPLRPKICGEVEILRRAPPRIHFLHWVAIFGVEALAIPQLLVDPD
jgi:hypothetical protein